MRFFPVAPACATTFLLTTLLASIVANAVPVEADELQIRQHHHDHDASGMHNSTDSPKISVPMPTSDTETSAAESMAEIKPAAPHGHGHGHGHGSHAPAMTELNDTDIHRWHHYPISYLAADFRLTQDQAIFGDEFDEDYDPDTASGHRGLAVAHVFGFYTAYFGALPIGLALRAANHPSHYIANGVFLILAILGWLAGAAYNAATPDRYEGSVYPKFVNILVLTSLILAVIDSLDIIKRSVALWRSGQQITWQSFASEVLRGGQDKWLSDNRYEMVGLVEEPDRISGEGPSRQSFTDARDEDHNETHAANVRPTRPSLWRQWSPPSRGSTASDGTLHDSPALTSPVDGLARKHNTRTGAYDAHDGPSGIDAEPEPVSKLARTGQVILTWIRRTQVVFAYVTLIVGFSTYTGMCRGSFVNSCAAHYIKGSIFFGYGLLTFGRYLGAYADLGWAWNRQPGNAKGPSAEMVECSVIFVYGITNTWLERLGSHAGDPYTVKQVQHISIAIMFWFAGLSGILLESKTIRRILASATGLQDGTEQPRSYAFSFNPLPALVIAVTGLAMAAHHQSYVFQVEIHALWGVLLAGGSCARWLTYFFLWLRPPTDSTLPSRPPTEVLTSFGYAAGGLVFMLSNEEIAFAAMRANFDDKMAFANFAIALIALVFCWTVVVMAVKGWAVLRLQAKSGRLQQG